LNKATINEENKKEKDEDKTYHIQIERPTRRPKNWGKLEKEIC